MAHSIRSRRRRQQRRLAKRAKRSEEDDVLDDDIDVNYCHGILFIVLMAAVIYWKTLCVSLHLEKEENELMETKRLLEMK
jgi:hypothetical protein